MAVAAVPPRRAEVEAVAWASRPAAVLRVAAGAASDRAAALPVRSLVAAELASMAGGGGYYRHHGGGGFIPGAVAGAVIGGAFASQGYYGDPGYAAPGYYDNGYDEGAVAVAPAPGGDDSVAYCMQTYRSYDPRSGTYLGNDGYRHPCP